MAAASSPEKPGDSFDECVDRVLGLLRAYTSEDVATALFVSDLWLPNVAGMLRHQLAATAYATLKPSDFTTSQQISTYQDFCSFLDQLYPVLPSFPSLEDYVPTPDWGDVRFHHEGTNYRIFFESEIENVYDWLTLFRMLYASRDTDYFEKVGRSPAQELGLCLKLQDRVITSIAIQPRGEDLDALHPGRLEVPPAEFWGAASAVFREYRAESLASPSELECFSIDLGSVGRASLQYSAFVDAFFSGELLPCFFIMDRGRHLPVLPRRWSYVLLCQWNRILAEHLDGINSETGRYSAHLAGEVCEYLSKRIRGGQFMPFVSAVTEEGEADATVFASAVFSEGKLVLVCVTGPATSGERIGQELSAISTGVHKAVDLLSTSPLRLALHAEDRIVEFQTDEGRQGPELVVVVVLPVASLTPGAAPIPESFPGIVVPLDQFLGIADEVTDAADIGSFLEYVEQLRDTLLSPASMLDLFASFKDTHGLLVGGAVQPSGIMVDPHWGCHLRYRSLAEFWSLYPEVHFFDDPRSWRLERETASRLRLTARSYLCSAIHCQVGSTNIFMTAPFESMSFEQIQISDLLMLCLEDSMSGFAALLERHAFFSNRDRVQVNFFPEQVVLTDARLSHLRHLRPAETFWSSDRGWVRPGLPGVRIVFDEGAVTDALEAPRDRSFDIALLLEVLTRLDSFAPSEAFDDIARDLAEHTSDPPRFKVSRYPKEVSFPDFVPVYKPSVLHYKRARKKVAELASELGVARGTYQLQEAKEKLNALRTRLVQQLNLEIAEYAYEAAVPYLLERIDALTHDYERVRSSVHCSLEHEVDFDREQTLAGEHKEYIVSHRAFRYLIEKFVQLRPQGSHTLDKERFRLLVAAGDVLQGFYLASDAIHYDLHAVGVEIDDDWLVQVEYQQELRSMELKYESEEAALDLGEVGCRDDRVDHVSPLDDYMDDLDAVFLADMGFTLTHLLGVLRVLSEWAAYSKGVEENTWYSADGAAIAHVCAEAFDGLETEEVDHVVEFLTLRPADVVRVLGQDDPCEDVPVWEYWKRPWRYNLRPLIAVGDCLFWGPHSARKSGVIWSHVPTQARLPADIPSVSVLGVLDAEKQRIEKALVTKASEIVLRGAENVSRNVYLHKRDEDGGHPDIGDYDVLGFDSSRNLVVSVECKHIGDVHCLKDARRLRERLFGRPTGDGGQVGRVERRHEYLRSVLPRVANVLDWPVDPERLPLVVSLFVSRHSYWWTRFPPRATEIIFARVDMLSEVLAGL